MLSQILVRDRVRQTVEQVEATDFLRHAGGGAGLGLLRLASLGAGLLPALVGLGRSALWPALPPGMDSR